MNPPPDAPQLPQPIRYTAELRGDEIHIPELFQGTHIALAHPEGGEVIVNRLNAAFRHCERFYESRYIEAVKPSPAATVAGEDFDLSPEPPRREYPPDLPEPPYDEPEQPPVADSQSETPTPHTDAVRSEYKRIGVTADYALERMAFLERELADTKRRNEEHMTMNTRWQDVGQAFGCPPGMRIDQYMLHIAPKFTAAKQDSERLEWLLSKRFTRTPLTSEDVVFRTRDEIDDARREEA